MINEFMEINSSLEMPKEQRAFEGHVLAEVLSEKIDALPSHERQKWIQVLLGYLASATHLSILKGVKVEKLMIPSDN
jgi:hypothetical protein